MNQLTHEKGLQVIAEALNKRLPEIYGKKMGFCLLIMDFDSTHSDYIANVERDCMIKALRETADRLEKKEDIPSSNHPVQ